jgi:hypothetical protein
LLAHLHRIFGLKSGNLKLVPFSVIMVEPLTIITTAISVAQIINRANKLLTAISSAPQEFKSFTKHVKSLALVLESVRADLVNNRQSIINRSRDLHAEKKLNLDNLMESCERGLRKVETLFRHYRRVQRGGLWSGWSWTNEGKAEVQATLNDLQSLTQLVDLFIQKEVAQGVGRLEGMAEAERIGIQRLDRGVRMLLKHHGIEPERELITLVTTSVLGKRWVGRLRARKAPQQSGRVKKPTPTRQPSRKNSTQLPNQKAVPTPFPNLERRNSLRSSNYNTRKAVPKPATTNSNLRFRGFRVAYSGGVICPKLYKKVSLACTQPELQDMVNRAQASTRSIDKNHHTVKYLMKSQDRKWSFAAGQSEGQRFAIVLKRFVED